MTVTVYLVLDIFAFLLAEKCRLWWSGSHECLLFDCWELLDDGSIWGEFRGLI